MRKVLSTLLAVCAASWALSPTRLARAQDYPSKPITMVVGYSAGGQADALTRAVARSLSDALKVPVVVEDKPGANGLIAGQGVANAAPDGSTLIVVTDAALTIDPQLPGSKQWDPMAALQPITILATAPLFIAANKDVSANTVSELVDLGKKGKLAFGSSGNATPHRLAGEILQRLGGFTMTHVAYKGTSASVTDLAGGQIPLVIGSSTALEPLVRTGKIKFIATTSTRRFSLLPDVPAIAETYPNFPEMKIFFGLMAPRRTPDAVVARLNTEIDKILSNPEMRETLSKLGLEAAGGTPAQFRAQVEADIGVRGQIIRDLDIRAD